MKTEPTKETPPPVNAPSAGLLRRMVERLDRAMKAAAERKTSSGCCGPGSGKGGKCC